MSNEAQIAYWNGDAGRTWAARDRQMARLLAPVTDALMEHAAVDDCRAILDVGCGGGSGTFRLAERLGSDACILGVDVSAPLLDVARAALAQHGEAAKRIAFLQADAAEHRFAPPRFDLLFSRFGVMFFDDPTAAFTTLRGAMQDDARLAFCCWQSLADNPWVALPLRAALSVLPPPPPQPARAPGPFAFAEADYLRDVLAAAGWVDVDIAPKNIDLSWPGEGDPSAAVRELVNTGPVGRLLAEADDAAREAVYAAAAERLSDYHRGDALVLPGATWFVTARNPAT